MLALHQSHLHTLLHDLFEQLLEQLRFLKPSMPVFRERGVMRDLLIEAQSGEPAPRQVHAQFLHQFPLAGDAVQIAHQKNAQQKFGINRRTASLAVTLLQPLAHKAKADVLFNQPQQMSLGNLIFQAEVVEQGFRAVVLPHHDQQASDDQNQTEHGRMLPSNMLLPNRILLIDVTFSTPTPVFNSDTGTVAILERKLSRMKNIPLLLLVMGLAGATLAQTAQKTYRPIGRIAGENTYI